MEDNQESFEPVTIQPKIVFGLNINVVGNIHFSQKQEIIYPIEGVIAFHDFVANKQKFLRLPEHTTVKMIAISPNRKLLAVVEQYNLENKISNSIIVYDLTTYKKRRTVTANDTKNAEFTMILFTADSKAVAALTKPPEEKLFLFLFDKINTIMQGHTGTNNQRAVTECIACNPNDYGMIAVAGRNIFKLMTRAERGFSSTSGNFKCDGIHITCMAWVSHDIIVAGTAGCKLLFIENGEIKAKYSAFTADILDLTMDMEQYDENVLEQSSALVEIPKELKDNKSITCMTSFTRGFVYVICNAIYVYEKESKLKFNRRAILQLIPDPDGSLEVAQYQIKNLAINTSQDTIIVTAHHTQIYTATLFPSDDELQTKVLSLSILGENLHTDEIVDIAICSWRPIVMTASKDKTVRIWNYETEKLELIKRYQVDITMVELHAISTLAAIGFSGQLKLMKIYFDDLSTLKTLNFPHCHNVKFSTFGHLMATAYENLIAITTVFNFETVKTLKGHFADVISIAWSKNDKFLSSGGADGAVYLWDIETGTRIHEYVNKGVQFPAVTIIHDNITTYALTSLGTFREITQAEVVREILPDPSQPSLLSMALSRSEQIMFISSDRGHIFSVQLPFMETGGGTVTNYRFFSNAITKLKITYDDTLLITASKSGTFGIWIIKNIEGKIASMDRNLLIHQEILIQRQDLIDKNMLISNLELRMKQQVDEFHYELNEKDLETNRKISEMQKTFQQTLKRNEEIFNEKLLNKDEKLRQKQQEIDELKQKHKQDNKEWEQKLSELVLDEYEKYTLLQQEKTELCTEYEDKLKNSNLELQKTISELEKKFHIEIRQREEIIEKLIKEKEQKKLEFIEYCRQTELDNDRCLIELQKQYEIKLKTEQDLVTKWREDTKVLQKKQKIAIETIEKKNYEIEMLKSENQHLQMEIKTNEENIQELQKQITKKEMNIIEKQRRLQELIKHNSNLEGNIEKQNAKIYEFENIQLKQMEMKLKTERSNLIEMEYNIEKLEKKIITLQRLLDDQKAKENSYKKDALLRKQYAQKVKRQLAEIGYDIYTLTENINNVKILKNGIRKLYDKYIKNNKILFSDGNLFINYQNFDNEINRQRGYMEKVITHLKNDSKRKSNEYVIRRLIKEKANLIIELNKLRYKLQEFSQRNRNEIIVEALQQISEDF